jgi:acetyltransferase-like isoleucine patch superfamily enzyme
MIDEKDLERRYIRGRANFLPWEARGEAENLEFEAYKDILTRRAGATFFGKNSFVSPDAHVYTEHFEIGANSWVAAGAILRGHIKLGDNTTVNPFAHIAGKVRIGNGVRIAGLASLYGFNHGYARTDRPIYVQSHTSRGIVIMDDVWIGANAVIVDGVTVAAHSIVAGGAIVTGSFPEYSIIGGNPARVLKNRMEST